jgi:hypothetical protein
VDAESLGALEAFALSFQRGCFGFVAWFHVAQGFEQGARLLRWFSVALPALFLLLLRHFSNALSHVI